MPQEEKPLRSKLLTASRITLRVTQLWGEEATSLPYRETTSASELLLHTEPSGYSVSLEEYVCKEVSCHIPQGGIKFVMVYSEWITVG